MTKSTFENMFQTIPLVQKGMEIGSSPIPKEQAEHFPGCVSGTLYYAEKQNESQCVAFGVTFPEYYVVAATLQDGRQISIRKETEEELYDLLYRVFYAPERITEPNNYGEYRRSHSVAFFTFSFGLRSSHGIPIPHINAHLLEIMDIFTFPNGETKCINICRRSARWHCYGLPLVLHGTGIVAHHSFCGNRLWRQLALR